MSDIYREYAIRHEAEISRLRAENATLRARLHEQAIATQETADRVHDSVVDVLLGCGAMPPNLNQQAHPVEQIVEAAVLHLQRAVERTQQSHDNLFASAAIERRELRAENERLRAENAQQTVEIADLKQTQEQLLRDLREAVAVIERL